MKNHCIYLTLVSLNFERKQSRETKLTKDITRTNAKVSSPKFEAPWVSYVSVNSKPDHPPWATPGDSHILVAPGVGFSLLCLARGSARGILNQIKGSIILKKSAIFALSLKQLSSSSFHMFIYAGSEQCDLVPIYTITNTQRIRIYPGKVKFILVKISSAPGQRKPNSIHVSYYGEFIRTLLFTGVQIRRVLKFV